jgi:hypothetical protein
VHVGSHICRIRHNPRLLRPKKERRLAQGILGFHQNHQRIHRQIDPQVKMRSNNQNTATTSGTTMSINLRPTILFPLRTSQYNKEIIAMTNNHKGMLMGRTYSTSANSRLWT